MVRKNPENLHTVKYSDLLVFTTRRLVAGIVSAVEKADILSN